MSTSAYFYPEKKRFVVTRRLLEDVLAYFGVDKIKILDASNRPEFWDADYDEPVLVDADGGGVYTTTTEPGSLFECNVSIDVALGVWESRRYCTTSMSLPFRDVAKQLASEIEERIPVDIREHVTLWDVSVLCGPWSETDRDAERTVAEGSFQISIGGDSTPLDTDEFFRLFQELPSVVRFMTWLEKQTGCEWRVGISVS